MFVYNLVKKLDFSALDEDVIVNYLCKDNYMHIRLKEFGNQKAVITGLEQKLTFLVTYLINSVCYNYVDKDLIRQAEDKSSFKDIWNICIGKFLISKEFRTILNELKSRYSECKGVKILPAYSKTSNYVDAFSAFGEVHNLTLNISQQPLDEFLEFLDISLDEYLFNEHIYLVVDEEQEIKNQKFIKKYEVKKSCSINLWEM